MQFQSQNSISRALFSFISSVTNPIPCHLVEQETSAPISTRKVTKESFSRASAKFLGIVNHIFAVNSLRDRFD